MRRLVLAWLGAVTALLAQKQAFDVNAMMKLVRISDPQVSPDGRTVAFVAQNVDLPENKKISQIWTV
jgi:dipeptidyl aminopeptidase/acylaminoacyl peptidase